MAVLLSEGPWVARGGAAARACAPKLARRAAVPPSPVPTSALLGRCGHQHHRHKHGARQRLPTQLRLAGERVGEFGSLERAPKGAVGTQQPAPRSPAWVAPVDWLPSIGGGGQKVVVPGSASANYVLLAE